MHGGIFIGWLLGYALKETSLVQAITAIVSNMGYIALMSIYLHRSNRYEDSEDQIEALEPGAPSRSLIAKTCNLSIREEEIVSFVLRGHTVSSISRALGISENTVRAHMKHIYEKTGVHKKQELIDYIERNL